MADKRHVFNSSPEASETEVPVAVFWNTAKVRTINPFALFVKGVRPIKTLEKVEIQVRVRFRGGKFWTALLGINGLDVDI
jgi:hypothetical protein